MPTSLADNLTCTGRLGAGRESSRASAMSLFSASALADRRRSCSTSPRWDVCAGTIIAREAGGKVYGKGGKEFLPEDLMDHHFFVRPLLDHVTLQLLTPSPFAQVVRAIGDTATEKGVDAQARIAKEFFATVEDWE